MDDDRQEFERLFRRHYDAVLAYALARADMDVAKDAAAQAFLVAWRRRHEVPPRALPWLLGVTRKALADHRRAAGRQGNVADRLTALTARRAQADGDPADHVAAAASIVSAFLTLSEADQEALRLVAWDGLDRGDAATVLGCSRAAFAVRLSRARRRLAAALARQEEQLDLHAQPLEAR